jgi:hypothetical protein
VSESRAPAPVEPVAQDLLLRGVRVRYLEAWREGDALLLVHGVFTSARVLVAGHPAGSPPHFAWSWRPTSRASATSEKPTRFAFSREAFAETLCDLLAGVGAPRAHVVGHDHRRRRRAHPRGGPPRGGRPPRRDQHPPPRAPRCPSRHRLALAPRGRLVLTSSSSCIPARRSMGCFRDAVYAAPDAATTAPRSTPGTTPSTPPRRASAPCARCSSAADLSSLGPRVDQGARAHPRPLGRARPLRPAAPRPAARVRAPRRALRAHRPRGVTAPTRRSPDAHGRRAAPSPPRAVAAEPGGICAMMGLHVVA